MASAEVTEDTGGGGPRYVRVAQALAGQIVSGKLRGRLEPERSLCERYDVSRVTIRRALSLLAEDGLLTPSWGSGWYVADRPLSEPPNALLNFTALAERRGLTSTSRLVGQEDRPADMDEAAHLQIVPGDRIIVLERVRLLENVPTLLQRSYLPLTHLPELRGRDLSDGSLYQTLEDCCGVVPVRADFTVEARPCSPRVAGLLGIDAGSPLLWTVQTTYDLAGRIIEWGWGGYPHDRYRFRATLTSAPAIPTAGVRPGPSSKRPAPTPQRTAPSSKRPAPTPQRTAPERVDGRS